jgi:hypothetical protein
LESSTLEEPLSFGLSDRSRFGPSVQDDDLFTVTFTPSKNAYGAASLGYRIPEGGDRVLNHVMAADVVSAASPHYGQVRVYATPREIAQLQDTPNISSEWQQRVHVDVASAVQRPVEASTREWQATAQRLASQQRDQQQLQEQASPALRGPVMA